MGTRINRLTLVVFAWSMVGCVSAVPRYSAPVPVRVIAPEDIAPLAELARYEDRRFYEPGRFDELGEHPSSEVRRHTALAVGRLKRREGVPLLVRLLSDPDSAVVATAAFSLGQVGDTAVVAELAALLSDPQGERSLPAVEAVAALGKLSSSAAAAAVEGFLRDTAVSPGRNPVVEAALLAAARLPRPADLNPVLRWCDAPDPEIRWRSAYALSRRPDPRATVRLIPLASDPDPRVRAHAVRGLTGPLADSAGVPRNSVQAVLLERVDDTDYSARINAIRALRTLQGSGVVVRRLEALLREDLQSAIVAAEALGRIGSAAIGSVDVIERIALDASAPIGLRVASLSTLVQLLATRAADVAERLATDPGWRIRAAAGRALAQLGPADRPSLATLIRDVDPRVAASTLRAAADSVLAAARPSRIHLIEAVASADVGVRTAALSGLRQLRDPSTLPILLDAYERSMRDETNDAALAALEALSALHDAGSPVANALFQRFRRPDDYLVRARAEALFADRARAAWGDPLPVETGRALQDYVSVTNRLLVQPINSGRRPHVLMVTDAGEIELELFSSDAPLTVENFLRLAEAGYFDGQEWPRVVPNFVIQGGDPRGDQTGGPGYAIRDEINRNRYDTGTLGMALSGPDSGGSQFFITHAPQPHLDGGYTVFGRVVSPREVVEQVAVGDRILTVRELR